MGKQEDANFVRQPSWYFQSVKMEFEYKSLSTEELLEVLTKNTMRYNQILLQGGSTDDLEILRETIRALQNEIEKRKEE